MHVGLNLIFLVPGETGGMEVYARELIPRLLSEAPAGMRFTAFVNREAGEAGAGPWTDLMPAVTVPVRARRRTQWVLGEQLLLAPLARREGVEVMHSLASTAPAWGAFRKVVTVHDLIYRYFPETHQGVRDLGMRLLVPMAARRADRVIAISQATREDLVRFAHVSSSKIDVVPQGVSLRAAPERLSDAETRARFHLGGRRVILGLSAKRPHKNLGALLGAIARIPAGERPVVVLAGYPTSHEEELRERARDLGVDEDVRFTGWLTEPELEALWSLTDVFVFPSLYEGFGLPVLEAMARGVPVICSSSSSLPEVAGNAALLFDPLDEAAIALAMMRVLGDSQLADALRAKGLQRVQEFTWERTARLTLAAYSRAAESRQR